MLFCVYNAGAHTKRTHTQNNKIMHKAKDAQAMTHTDKRRTMTYTMTAEDMEDLCKAEDKIRRLAHKYNADDIKTAYYNVSDIITHIFEHKIDETIAGDGR